VDVSVLPHPQLLGVLLPVVSRRLSLLVLHLPPLLALVLPLPLPLFAQPLSPGGVVAVVLQDECLFVQLQSHDAFALVLHARVRAGGGGALQVDNISLAINGLTHLLLVFLQLLLDEAFVFEVSGSGVGRRGDPVCFGELGVLGLPRLVFVLVPTLLLPVLPGVQLLLLPRVDLPRPLKRVLRAFLFVLQGLLGVSLHGPLFLLRPEHYVRDASAFRLTPLRLVPLDSEIGVGRGQALLQHLAAGAWVSRNGVVAV